MTQKAQNIRQKEKDFQKRLRIEMKGNTKTQLKLNIESLETLALLADEDELHLIIHSFKTEK